MLVCNFLFFIREIGRIRTGVNKSHNLVPNPLGHNLHIICTPCGIWTQRLPEWKSGVLDLTRRTERFISIFAGTTGFEPVTKGLEMDYRIELYFSKNPSILSVNKTVDSPLLNLRAQFPYFYFKWNPTYTCLTWHVNYHKHRCLIYSFTWTIWMYYRNEKNISN